MLQANSVPLADWLLMRPTVRLYRSYPRAVPRSRMGWYLPSGGYG
jgi:hypothetical protein